MARCWLAGVLALGLALGGCARVRPLRYVESSVGPAPSSPFRSKQQPPAPPPPAFLPPAQLASGKPMALAALVEIALRNSPSTRAAWYEARAAAAQVGARTAAYFPGIELNAQAQVQHQTTQGGRVVSDSASLGPGVGLSHLVLDLGGRAADVEEARQQLAVANFTHSAAVQDLVLRVEQTYYQLLAFNALRDASAANLHEAEIALEAATERQKAGVATIADVLQAKTAASQARLSQRNVEGLAETAKGALAAALGLPATIEVAVGELPARVDVQEVGRNVDALVAEAVRQRPELAAARGQVGRAEARAKSAWAAGWPNLALTGSASRQYYLGPSELPYGDNYGAQLVVRVPLFTGFRDTYNALQAEEAVGAARARADSTEQAVALQVWTSYQTLKTAAQRLLVARDLLESASASAEVATGRYQAGAGTLIDLLTAQAALAAARAQDVQSRADYLVALALLAHDTGALGPSGDAPP